MSSQPFINWINKFGAEKIIAVLTPYISELRRAKIDKVLAQRIDSVQLAIEAPANPHNAAAALRTADALGLCRTHCIASNHSLAVRRITLGAFHWISVHEYPTITEFAATMRQQPMRVFGAMPHAQQTLEQLPVDKPCCVLFGNEQRGLSEQAQQICDGFFSIPMVGMSESLNVSIAIAITLHDLLRRKRALLTATTDLTAEQMQLEKALNYLRALDERLVKNLLERIL